MAEIMRAVNQQIGTVLLGYLLVKNQIRGISVHRKKSFSDHKDSIVRILLPGFFEHGDHLILVKVCKLLDILGGRDSTFLEAVVRNVVHDYVIPRSDQGFDHAETSHPAS